LDKQGYVAPVDVFMHVGMLDNKRLEDWRRGLVPFLERVLLGNLSKVNHVLKITQIIARSQGLQPSETVYKRWGKRPKNRLRFSKLGSPYLEKLYGQHYVSKKLRAAAQEKEARCQESKPNNPTDDPGSQSNSPQPNDPVNKFIQEEPVFYDIESEDIPF
jgi:hypothetical protein